APPLWKETWMCALPEVLASRGSSDVWPKSGYTSLAAAEARRPGALQDVPGEIDALTGRVHADPHGAALEVGRMQIGVLLHEARADEPAGERAERSARERALEGRDQRPRGDQRHGSP